jgi:hypothetical protein
MQTDENIGKIKRRLAAAFQPFRCVAKDLDYGKTLCFKVSDADGKSIIETEPILIRLLIDDFENIVEEAKADIRLRRPDFP